MLQRLQGVDSRDNGIAATKAIPVKSIYFDKAIKWPGLPGAAACLSVGAPTNVMSNTTIYCDSILLYRGEFIINGQYFMPMTSASILCYEF